MNKRLILLALLGVVAAACLVWAGMFIQRKYQIARIEAGVDFARDMTGLNDAIPPAPPWDEWLYPRAKKVGTVEGAAVRVAGKLVRPAGRYAVLSTPDSFEDVAQFYAERAAFEDPEAVAASRNAFSSQGTLQGEATHLLDDSTRSDRPDSPRPFRSKSLLRRSPSYDLTVFITRADDESHTHIVLLYDPNTEPAPQAAPLPMPQ